MPRHRRPRAAATRALATLAAVSLGLLACDRPPGASPSPEPRGTVLKLIPLPVQTAVDLLFVVDDSPSMAGHQDWLATNAARFADILANIEGGLPDLHFGVVSTSEVLDSRCTPRAGEGRGTLVDTPAEGRACDPGLAPGARFFSNTIDLDTQERVVNYRGTLADGLACLLPRGASGCEIEQPFAAATRALDGSNAANAGFLREDASLLVVFIGNDDDCSTADPASLFDPARTDLGPADAFRCAQAALVCDGAALGRSAGPREACVARQDGPLVAPRAFADVLRRLKPDAPHRVIVAAAVGDPGQVAVVLGDALPDQGAVQLAPSCVALGAPAGDPFAGARPGVRFAALLDEFPNRATFGSFCDADLSPLLARYAERLPELIGNPCLDDDVALDDLDPAAPGLQLECSATDRTEPYTEHELQRVLPRCAMLDAETPDRLGSTQPCWYTVVDEASCGSGTNGVRLGFLPEHRVARDGTYTFIECVAR